MCLTSEAAEIYEKPANNLIGNWHINIFNHFLMFFAPCIMIKLCNINQRISHFKKSN